MLNLNNLYHKTILIVEDDEEATRLLIELLSYDFEDIHFASNGIDALELYKIIKPDIILSDISMPYMNGLELLLEIRKVDKIVPFIFLSARNEVKYLQKAIDLKVSGYIVKPIIYAELIEKIALNICEENKHAEINDLLSKREFEVFLDTAKGMKPAQIAQKYQIKAKTVSTYRNRILEKLNFSSNSEIVKYALENGLI